MATYNNAIDPRPKKASQNLVTSGGVFDNMGALDVSELNATENPHTPAIYADLSAALAAISTDYQKGGMSIKFIQGTVQSSDNKYVQYRLMSDVFNTTVTNWQGVDDEPTAGSDNLVKSGGIARSFIKYEAKVVAGKSNTTEIIIDIALNTGDFYNLVILLEDGIFTNNLLESYYILNDGTEVNNTDVASNRNIVLPFNRKVYCTVNNVKSLKFIRTKTSAIIGSGKITAYAVKSEFFGLVEDLQQKSRDGILDNVGYFTFKGNSIAGKAFEMSAYTKCLDRAFTLSIDDSDTILFGPNDANGVNTSFIYPDGSKLSASGYIVGQDNDIVYMGRRYTVNIPSSGIIGIELSRVSASVIANGTLTARIILADGKFYTKGEIDSKLGYQNTINNTVATVPGSVYKNVIEFGNVLDSGSVDVSVTGDTGIVENNLLNIGKIVESGEEVDFVGAFAYPFTYKINLSDNPCKGIYVKRTNAAKVTGVGNIVLSAYVDVPTKANVQGSIDKIVYVSTTGNDMNDGNQLSPVLTINQALKLGNIVKISGGVYKEQTINFSLCGSRNVSIFADDAEKVCLLSNIIASSATKVSGYENVYSCQIDADLSARNWLFQFGVYDVSTLIDDSDRTYIHSRRTYRCDCTRLVRVASVAAIDSYDGYSWYEDNGILYFSSPATVSAEKPIFVGGGNLFSGTDGKLIKMNGIRSYGRTINAKSLYNAEFMNCAAIGCTGGAGFALDLSQNTILKMCEAALCDSSVTTSTGDGFNVHSSSAIHGDTDMDSVFSTFTMVDCWAHDNFNDGYSDHEGCNGHIQNGVYEFNSCGADGKGGNSNGVGYAGHGGGITPAHGAHDIICGSISQRNYDDGVRYTSNDDMTPQGCEIGTFTAIGVISRNNAHYGFNVNKDNQIADIMNCIASGNGTENYHSENGAIMRMSIANSQNT
jgi:hypothetical protein